MELDLIGAEPFRDFLGERFAQTNKRIASGLADAVLAITRGHPYATQELAYFLWEETPRRAAANDERLEEALAKVLRSEHAHFSLVWDRASPAQRLVLQALAR